MSPWGGIGGDIAAALPDLELPDASVLAGPDPQVTSRAMALARGVARSVVPRLVLSRLGLPRTGTDKLPSTHSPLAGCNTAGVQRRPVAPCSDPWRAIGLTDGVVFHRTRDRRRLFSGACNWLA